MEGLIFLLVLCAVALAASGPIALIISIIALKNSNRILQQLREFQWEKQSKQSELQKPLTITENKYHVEQKAPPAELYHPPEEPDKTESFVKPKTKTRIELDRLKPREFYEKEARHAQAELEQKIGTRWVLVAGIIAVIFAAGFFLKYAYDNNLVGPAGRVIIVAVAGFIALAIGEVTRRRDYGIVAKSVTALGFAILYSAVFAACAYYELISSTYAFVFSIIITAAAMLYALSLDEIAIAFLSLLGGFLTPVIISTGKNMPVQLFIYVLILDAGAVVCAYYRKWRLVDIVSFIGTFLLYTGWFEKFYRPEMPVAESMPGQMPMALIWLTIFFLVYLLLPVLYDLLRKVEAKKDDVFLVLANAAVVLYYLWTMLYKDYRAELSFTTLGLCAIHLGMMAIVFIRCKFDLNLRLAYLAIGLFFLTITIPLYFKMYAIAIAWAIESAVLILIGLRYRSYLTQLGGAIALLLSFGQLMRHLPMHSAAFTLVFNPVFGTWFTVVCAIVVCHILYRTTHSLTEEQRDIIAQASYAAAALLLLATIAMEWFYYCRFNVTDSNIERALFYKGIVIVIAAFPLLLLTRPACPKGQLCQFLAAIIAAGGAIMAVICLKWFYSSNFVIFANVEFLIVLFFAATLFGDAWVHHKRNKEEQFIHELPVIFKLSGVIVLWILMTEEIYLYWYCKDKFLQSIENWKFLAHMYISVMWALYGAMLMVVGFWKKSVALRYISLGIFGLLLLKVFILDTSKVESVYRIAAFLATGVTLVAVSYLYQYLRKKGFFDSVLSDTNNKT
ncbi:MAG: DUF2339 domain-containing protein [Sedimentisphaerales bacterium]|nr:DUF2339 domain-containing protein [Sedimentisphaerales bacterium]